MQAMLEAQKQLDKLSTTYDADYKKRWLKNTKQN
jgi:hypothetical protein